MSVWSGDDAIFRDNTINKVEAAGNMAEFGENPPGYNHDKYPTFPYLLYRRLNAGVENTVSGDRSVVISGDDSQAHQSWFL